jgi:hypothetical protein
LEQKRSERIEVRAEPLVQVGEGRKVHVHVRAPNGPSV